MLNKSYVKLRSSKIIFCQEDQKPNSLQIKNRKYKIIDCSQLSNLETKKQRSDLKFKISFEPHKSTISYTPHHKTKLKRQIKKIIKKTTKKCNLKNLFRQKDKHLQSVSFKKMKIKNLIFKKRCFQELAVEIEKCEKNITRLIKIIKYHNQCGSNSKETKKKFQLTNKEMSSIFDQCRRKSFKDINKRERLLQKLESLKSIQNHLKTKDFAFESLKNLHNELGGIKNMPKISRTQLRNYLMELGYKHKQVYPKKTKKILSQNSVFSFYDRLSQHMNSEPMNLFSFDCSSFSSTSFKKKSWSLVGLKHSSGVQYSYSQLHLLLLISQNQVVSFWFVKGNLSSRIITHFFSRSFKMIQTVPQYQNKNSMVILDNATMNKSLSLLKICDIYRLKLLYICPATPDLNPIETVFGIIKASLRRFTSLNQ